jgi:crotonobetainyl-CoA:carnitine CoA-transferase CaiB-like acyl-CoA transferase
VDLLNSQQFFVESHSVAAAYAGWLLRQFGAAVEHTSALDPEGIGAFLSEGALFAPNPGASVKGGSTLITDAPVTPAQRERLGRLASERLVVWITPWGLETPWAERPATDLTVQAAGGWMAAVGEPGREPLAAPNSQGFLTAGLYAAITALAPVLPQLDGERPRTGIIDVSVAESVLATTIYDVVNFQYTGSVRQRAGNRFSAVQPLITTLPCKDGHIGLHGALHRQWLRVCDIIGHPELVADPRFADPGNRARNVKQLDEYLLPWFAEHTRFEAYHALQQAGIPASAHPTVAEVLDSPHLRARDWWHSVRTPSGREFQVPGPPARVLASPAAAPVTPADSPWERGKLRVVDLAMGWAGPLVSHVLACRGADVIKVESHARFDWWRGSRPPGDNPELALHERSHVFNSVNRGKRGITLNLTTERGRELAQQLIETADVVIENYAAGVIEKLGLTYEVLSARNPRLVMLRQPAFGSTGPESSYLAFGNTIEGMSGLTSMMGYESSGPVMMSSAFGDPVNGLIGTVAVLSALAAREQDGRGRCLEAAQVEAFMPMLGEALIEYQRTGVLPVRMGNAPAKVRARHSPATNRTAGYASTSAAMLSGLHWLPR